MPTWIVLLRGINVGGRGMLPMKRLVELMEEIGCTDVRTYIQSGNAVCTSKITSAATLAQKIGKAILAGQGFEPKVMVLSREELVAAAKANPYPTEVPKALHLFFLAAPPPDPSLAALAPVKLAHEHYTLVGSTFYFYATEGFGTSKIAARFEKLAKVHATARNWNTVQALLALADGKAPTGTAASPSRGTARSSPSTRASPRPTRGRRKTPR